MAEMVTPKVYLIGFTEIDSDGVADYLRDTDNMEFAEAMKAAYAEGASAGEILCSFYAKLCYQALTVGHNDNITRVRDITDNIRGTFDSGHSSVFEHCNLNFVASNVSRVLTHELVRHRTGTAFSQESGRYCRTDSIDFVTDPIIAPVQHIVQETLEYIEEQYKFMVELMGMDEMDFAEKKKVTSALRRILPNGMANEIGFSMNVRALRHVVMLRTSRHAEREIRDVFGQVYDIVRKKFPLVFHGAEEAVVDGLVEVSGMKTNPY